MLGITDAVHEESEPQGRILFIGKLSRSLAGREETIRVHHGSLAFRAYGSERVAERYACGYGFNEQCRKTLESGDLRVTGTNDDQDARFVELTGPPFFLATLFLPQLSSTERTPHPLITAFIQSTLFN